MSGLPSPDATESPSETISRSRMTMSSVVVAVLPPPCVVTVRVTVKVPSEAAFTSTAHVVPAGFPSNVQA